MQECELLPEATAYNDLLSASLAKDELEQAMAVYLALQKRALLLGASAAVAREVLREMRQQGERTPTQ